MADIRSLLRNELASRKGPQEKGTSANRSTKKRKVDNEDDLTHRKRKHSPVEAKESEESVVKRPNIQTTVEEEHEETGSKRRAIAGTKQAEQVTPKINESQESGADEGEKCPDTISKPPETPQDQTVNEDEWAAFEREVAAPTRVPQAPAAIAAPATISAAPVSAEELAEQQQHADERKGPTREAEVEGEREDAARSLEAEFDEMDQLEERVKALKQRREELRKKRAVDNANPEEQQTEKQSTQPSAEPKGEPAPADDSSDDDDDDQDEYDWDNWRFGK